MTTVYDTDEEGNIIVAFDSRWQFPELLGYSPGDPQYEALRRMWDKATQTMKKVDENNPDSPSTNTRKPNTRGEKITEEAKDAKTGQG